MKTFETNFFRINTPVLAGVFFCAPLRLPHSLTISRGKLTYMLLLLTGSAQVLVYFCFHENQKFYFPKVVSMFLRGIDDGIEY